VTKIIYLDDNFSTISSILTEDKNKEFVKIHGKASQLSMLFTLVLSVFANFAMLFYWLLPAVKNFHRFFMGMERNWELPFKTV
jgi:hypothetical protein